MKKAKSVKKVTFAECEKMYKTTKTMYCQYLEQTGKAKFGTLAKAATAVMRSRGHLFDCIEGRRKLDSVRSLAWTMSGALGLCSSDEVTPFK